MDTVFIVKAKGVNFFMAALQHTGLQSQASGGSIY